jgi:hypothetical protein
MKIIYRYFVNLFLAADQLVNTIVGGDPDETISSRVGKCQRGDYGLAMLVLGWILAIVVNIIFIWQGWDHCRRSIEDDEGANDLVLRAAG